MIRYQPDDAASYALAAADPTLGRLIERVGPVEYAGMPTRFEELARIIVAQQLSDAAARAITARLREDIGLDAEAFLSASADGLAAAGLSVSKRRYLVGLARAVHDGDLDLGDLDRFDDQQVIGQLTRFCGVGDWTARSFLLFGIERPDVILANDLGVRGAIGRLRRLGRRATVVEAQHAAERWRPYRSAASLYLYRDAALASTSSGYRHQ